MSKHTTARTSPDDGLGAVGTISFACPTCASSFEAPVRIDSLVSHTESIGNERLEVSIQHVIVSHICTRRV